LDTVLAFMLLSATGQPVLTDHADIKSAVTASVEACAKWVLEPATWADGIDDFPTKAGLGSVLQQRGKIAEAVMPPPALRRSNHHWFASAGNDQGVFLTTSDVAPFCHIAGGGQSDFQPVVESFLAEPAFLAKWRKLDSSTGDGMVSDRFVSKEDDAFEMIISRASKPAQRTDRVQFLATAQFAIRK
jgi:hypothetical protein